MMKQNKKLKTLDWSNRNKKKTKMHKLENFQNDQQLKESNQKGWNLNYFA